MDDLQLRHQNITSGRHNDVKIAFVPKNGASVTIPTMWVGSHVRKVLWSVASRNNVQETCVYHRLFWEEQTHS